ncbi:unnamed protein product [Calicophoron daubneyi]|uniref:Uncharacterized protein n=1 Tax=Calicophoron daubneyi TaxID=300641 RepID=A0AAV2T1H1_CALDB
MLAKSSTCKPISVSITAFKLVADCGKQFSPDSSEMGFKKKKETSEIDPSKQTPTFKYRFSGACCDAGGCGTFCFVKLCYSCAVEELIRGNGIPPPLSYLIGNITSVALLFCWGPVLGLIRRKFRRRHSIRGSTSKDCLLSCLCPCCVFTQMLQEIRFDYLEKKKEEGESEVSDDSGDDDDEDSDDDDDEFSNE